MENKIKETTKNLSNGIITKDEADKILLDLFGVIKRSIKFTKKMKERIDKYWNRNVVTNYMTSNIPQEIMEYQLMSILSIKNEEKFLKESKDMGLLKNVL